MPDSDKLQRHVRGQVITLFTCILLAPAAWAQEDGRTRYLFGGNMKVSGAGGMLVQVGSIDLNSNITTGAGVGGGLIFDRRLLVGAYAMGLTSQVDRMFPYNGSDWEARFNFAHGGLWLQYSLWAREPMHPFIGVQLGWGAAEWNFEGDDDYEDGGPPYFGPSDKNDQVLVITPTLGAQMNITPWFRPDLVIGYRIVDGLELDGTSDGSLDGPFFGIDLMFGGLGD